MPFETFRIGYRKLFDVWVDHRYFLDFREQPFELVDAPATPVDIKVTLLQISRRYNVNQFWQIKPNADTEELMQNQQLIFKPIPRGFRVGIAVKEDENPKIALPESLALTFEIHPTDGYFMIYTDIEKVVADALAQPIAVVEDGLPVLRNQVFRLQNQSGTDMLTTNETIQLADLMVFKPEEGRVQRPPMGLIQISHTSANSFLDANGRVSSNPPNFRVLLRNRLTEWEYRQQPVGSFVLVRFGRITAELNGRQLPNPTPANTVYRNGQFRSVIF
jgi:hypothetical protein